MKPVHTQEYTYKETCGVLLFTLIALFPRKRTFAGRQPCPWFPVTVKRAGPRVSSGKEKNNSKNDFPLFLAFSQTFFYYDSAPLFSFTCGDRVDTDLHSSTSAIQVVVEGKLETCRGGGSC